jgi:hypothetical protein
VDVPDEPPPVAGDAAAHSHAGPHGGHVIELGADEYHAELVLDKDAGTATIYLLDSAAKEAVAIEATEIALNTRHDGQARQYPLAASPEAGNQPGTSSRFVSSDNQLITLLATGHADAELVLEINQKQYRGKVGHLPHG